MVITPVISMRSPFRLTFFGSTVPKLREPSTVRSPDMVIVFAVVPRLIITPLFIITSFVTVTGRFRVFVLFPPAVR